MGAIEIDITGYLKLLEYEKELKSQGKSLYHENKEKDLEMLKYQVILEHHIEFCQREEYRKLVEEFLDHQFGTAYFDTYFMRLWDGTRSQINELEQTIFQEKQSTFVTDSRAKAFSEAVSGIFWALETLTDGEPDEKMEGEVFEEMKEQEFLHEIQEVWKEMQEILKEN